MIIANPIYDSVFEQKHFFDDQQVLKRYNHTIEDEQIQVIAEELNFICTDEETRKNLEAEREFFRLIQLAADADSAEKDSMLKEKEHIILENKKQLEEKIKPWKKKTRLLKATQ